MTARIITPETVTEFQDSLLRLERSPHTIGRYMHDVKSYYAFLGGQEVTGDTGTVLLTQLRHSLTHQRGRDRMISPPH